MMTTRTCACGRQRQLYRACEYCGYPQAPASTEEVHAPPLEWDKRPNRAKSNAEDGIIASSGYEALTFVLRQALDQAQSGKGRERHANGRQFDRQPIMEIGRMVGLGYPTGQAQKKAQEAVGMFNRGEADRAVNELLGAINYLAAAIMLIRETEGE